MSVDFSRRSAHASDLEALVELRLIAMRPSLEKLGRFNPIRARQRFVDQFSPTHTTILVDNGKLFGCFALMPQGDDLYLAHLYLLPEYQGQNIGQTIVKELQAKAQSIGKDIYLTALSHSDAEQFYGRLGFRVVERGEVDMQMVWRRSYSAPTA